MKILKKILIGIVVVVVLLLVISFFLPSKVHVERAQVIKAPVDIVFNQVNTLKNWGSWSYWDNIDSAMKSEFVGTEMGVGAIHKWSSEHEMVGTGSMEITESVVNEKVITKLQFDGEGDAIGSWLFQQSEEGTNVTVMMDMDMGANPIAKFFAFIMHFDAMIGTDFEKTLTGLKNHAESLPVKPHYDITVKEITSQPAYTIVDSTQISGISAKLGELYGELMAHITTTKEMIVGQPFAIYHKWDIAGTIVLEAGLPVQNAKTVKGRIKATAIDLCKAVTASHFGKYEDTGLLHQAIDEYVAQNNHKVIGSPWEVYVTDPGTEPDTSKWETQVFYPVE